MNCADKERLVAEYEAATRKFSDAVSELQRKTGTSPKAAYDQLSRAADEERVKSEQARLAVEKHIASHEC